ncbi:MAG TPA: hypothetical protein VHS27_19435 [Gaiellales bacterium]|nr:hypothetical protein [Gaiellales bacterium]
MHALVDIAVIVAVVLAVGAMQLRSVRRNPSGDPKRNLRRFGRGVVARVAVLAAVYLGGYAVGFHHGRYDCHGYYVSSQLAEKYSHRIPGGAGVLRRSVARFDST